MPARSLTVLQLLPALDGGGVERGTVELADELVRRGHRSLVISEGGRMVEALTEHGTEHIAWPIGRKSPLTLRFVPQLRRLLRDQHVDILHARSRVPAWIAYLAWRGIDKTRRPRFVTTVHGQYSVNWYSAIMTRGERVVAVSDTIRQYIENNYPRTDPARLEVIPRGVDPDAFPFGYQPDDAWRDTWRQTFPELEGRFVVCLAGRLTRLKGHYDLLDVIEKLRAMDVNAHGLIVGGEDPRRQRYAQDLRDTVQKRGLEPHVTFTGNRSDIREVMAASDTVVSLTQQPESFGRTVLEALRLGRPTFGYDHGGVGEVLRAVYPQGLAPIGDTDAMARQLAASARGELEKPAPSNAFLLSEMLERTVGMYHYLTDAHDAPGHERSR